MTNWRQGKVLLPNIDLEIVLPENVLVRDVGEDPFFSRWLRESQKANGSVASMFSLRMNKWWFTIDATNPRNPFEATYIKGHEEGHVCDLTGNLHVLYQEARRIGINVEHLTEQEALELDERSRRILENPLVGIEGDENLEATALLYQKNPKYPYLIGLTLEEVMAIVKCQGRKSYFESEYSAYIAGLIALKKAGYNGEKIRKLEQEINDTTLAIRSKEIPRLVESLGMVE